MNVYHLRRHFDCVCNVDLWHCAAKQMITGWHFGPAGCSQPNKILCSNRCNQFSSVRPDYLGVCYAAKLDFSFLCVDLAWLHVMGRPRASTGQDDRITFFTWNGCSNVQYIHLPHISEMMQQVRSPMRSMCRGVVKWSCFTYVPPWTSIREPVIQLNIIFSSLFLVFVVVDRFFFSLLFSHVLCVAEREASSFVLISRCFTPYIPCTVNKLNDHQKNLIEIVRGCIQSVRLCVELFSCFFPIPIRYWMILHNSSIEYAVCRPCMI